MSVLLAKILPYAVAFLGALVLTLILTPVIREVNRKLGMVDRPDARRINKVPIPRGGWLAIVLGVNLSYIGFNLAFGRPLFSGTGTGIYPRMLVLSCGIALLGLADDRFSLRPLVKLFGQIVIAFGVWVWADLGFADLFPGMPLWLDCVLTVFWIVGAVNAFNLIDGLDGLATGLGFIAVLGVTGTVFFLPNATTSFLCFSLLGGLLGFLRYNYNPASVFLGDCGSMYIGFMVSTLPLAAHLPNSFMVSLGVPLLAMGVPIFDTSLAILRRSIRHLLHLREAGASVGNDKVMTADTDHLHHRILRSMGMNQRRAAWALYALAAAAVATGLVGAWLKSRAAGLWLVALAAAAVIVFRDMASVELFDAGRLLGSVAHTRKASSRRRLARLAVPFFVGVDLAILVGVFFLTVRLLRLPPFLRSLRVEMLLRVTFVFGALIFFRAYSTAWSRAMLSNYCRLLLATVFGSLIGAAAVYYAPTVVSLRLLSFTAVYAVISFVALLLVRLLRGIVRDVFYAIDCSRIKGRKDVSRMLVYGAGLRYQAFRRELVRTTAANERMIVGLLDDDPTLRGKYIGGIRILGTINQAPEIINAVNADAVVIACDVTDEWLEVVRRLLAPTGVKVTYFSFNEKEV